MIKSSEAHKKLTQKEQKIVDLAKISWGKTLREFYFPPLDTPRFIFDYTHKEGFYIDPDHKWQSMTCDHRHAAGRRFLH